MALSHAILATLRGQPCSGYDLMKKFEGSVGFFWRATHQQIYRELAKMEEQGWLQSEAVRQEGRPDKKIYSLTAVGTEQLRQWILATTEESPAVRDEILVKLFAGSLVSPQVLIREIEQLQQHHQQRLERYHQIAQRYFADPQALASEDLGPYLTLLYGIRYEQGWLEWSKAAIAALLKTVVE